MSSLRRIADRVAFIREVIDRQGTASYEALAESLQVSTMTVRRDWRFQLKGHRRDRQREESR